MRIIAIALVLTLFVSVCFALDITTRDGTTYRHCDVTRVEPDGIVVTHSEGVARIPFENLPQALQTKYHFDPATVAEYRKRIADAQAAAAKKAAEEAAQRRAAQLQAQREREAQLRKTSEPAATPMPTPATPSAWLATQWQSLPSETQLIAIIAGAAIGLAICYSLIKALERRLHWRRIRADSDEYFALLDHSEGLPIIPTNILLQPTERSFYCAPSALYETRAVRYYQSGFAGFRVARGVWIGGSSGRSVSHQEWAKLDSGTLTVTNQRIVFDGGAQTRTVLLRKIVSVDSMRDSVEVSVENRQKSMVFEAANPLILATIIRLACKGYDDLSRSTYELEYEPEPPPPPPKPKKSRSRSAPKAPEPESDYDIHARTLGLSGVFDYSDVKRRYYERIKEYHPDKVAALGTKLRELAEIESKKINAAYEFFTKRFEVNRNA